MRRLLVIAYYFPPLGGIGSLRALKFCQYLPDFGWEPTVVAPRNGAYFRDPSLTFPEERVVRTSSLELSRLGKRMLGSRAGDTEPVRTGTTLARLRGLVRRHLYRPDAQIGWYPFAVAAGRRALRERLVDAIFSSSFPVTAHLVARRLQRESGLPWVAEFRDPWTDLLPYDDKRRRLKDEVMERAILRDATHVVTASPRWRELLMTRGARGVTVITNGFDPTDFPTCGQPSGTVVSYMGSYYPDRQDLATPLRALAGLQSEGGLPLLRLRFIGDVSPAIAEIVHATGLSENLEVTGFVAHRESLRLLAESALLLLAGPVSRDTGNVVLQGHIPAKVFEYLGAGRPILYVGHPESDLGRLLRAAPGVRQVDPGDTGAARAALVALLAERPSVARGVALEPFTRKHLTGLLADTLSEACR